MRTQLNTIDAKRELLTNLDKLSTTELGEVRIKRNLDLSTNNVVKWCKAKIEKSDSIIRNGKNFYAVADGAEFTINAGTYTIITAHAVKTKGDTTNDRA